MSEKEAIIMVVNKQINNTFYLFLKTIKHENYYVFR